MNSWTSVGDFFAMGGHGLYVWGAYGATAVLMAAEALLAAARRRQAVAQARELDREGGAP